MSKTALRVVCDTAHDGPNERAELAIRPFVIIRSVND
jgi:hypothetical protein